MVDGLARLRPGGPGAAVDVGCDLVWVEGPEAEHFLQGVLSNDIARLPPRASLEALLLDVKGHVRHGVHVHRDGPDAFTLVTSRGAGDALVEDLERLHVSEEIDIFGDAGDLVVTNAPGDPGADLEIAMRPDGLRGLVGKAADALAAALAVPLVPAGTLDALRVEMGEPDPNIDGAGRLVQEAGLDGIAVSFSKGCYLGQETVARVAHRGKVNRRLAGLRLDAPTPTGAAVSLGGREVGRLGAVAEHPLLGPIALAVLRNEAAPGVAVDVGGVPGRVVGLPFPTTA